MSSTNSFSLIATAVADASATRPQVRAAMRRRIEPQANEPELGNHIPALDGVRGLAVLLVLWCHAGAMIETPQVAGILDRLAFSSSRLATSGVDLFFVLSGFLITGILYDAKGTNHYFRNF